MDIARMSVVGRGEAGRLTPKMLAVLLVLAERPGEIVTRPELIARAWPDSNPTDDALSFAVRELRRALGDDARTPRIIETVHGVGYRIIAEGVVREEATAEPEQMPAPPPAVAPVAADAADAAAQPSVAREAPRANPAWTRWAFAAAVVALGVAATVRYWPAAVDDDEAAPAQAFSPVLVTSDAGAEDFPALSPDGTFVAYSARTRPTAFADIRVKRVEGADVQAFALTDTPDVSELWPSWSPDGRFIAYQAHTSTEHAVMIAPAAGGTPRRVMARDIAVAGRLEWSADGRHLLGALPEDAPGRAPRLHLIDVQDGTVRPLRHDRDGSGWDLNPAYSPDGRWIAFRHGLSPSFDLYVIPAEGGAARRLTTLGNVRWGISWTSDGKEVVFATDEGGQSSIHTVALADARVRATGLVDASLPHVARNAPRLAFQRPRVQLGLSRIDHRGGGTVTPVATSTGTVFGFQTSPARDRIAYFSDRGGRFQLWVHDAARGTDRAYDVGGTVSSLRWTEDARALLVVVRRRDLDEAMRLDVETGQWTALDLRRPVLRQLVDGGAPDRLFGLVQHGGQLQVARFDREGWKETTRGVMAHRLVRVAGTPGVLAHTLLESGRMLRVDVDLATRSIDIPLPIGVWTADADAIWYTSATGTVKELRRYRPDSGEPFEAWPLPAGHDYTEIGMGFLGDDLVLATVTADRADIGVVMQFR